MFGIPIKYDEPVFRPPAEANSAIIQATIGCSWNRCAFCEMYTSKNFRIRKFEDVRENIKKMAVLNGRIRKVFLADGNAFTLSASLLMPVLGELNKHFTDLQRISAYALPTDILRKSATELREIRKAGLRLLYVGIESGDDEVLKKVRKGETYTSTAEGILKAHSSGIETSVMVLNGLGGKEYSYQHAVQSARLINQVQPRFLSTLTLSFPYGLPHFQSKFDGDYQAMTLGELATELKIFIGGLDLQASIFRSDHVSNQLVLKGRLPGDKQLFIRQIDQALGTINKEDFPETPMFL
ncbi:MAG: radical SAM protein [Bacteroidales bacterium]|nr:radical SAM protein [Bacteroidales bacterium]